MSSCNTDHRNCYPFGNSSKYQQIYMTSLSSSQYILNDHRLGHSEVGPEPHVAHRPIFKRAGSRSCFCSQSSKQRHETQHSLSSTGCTETFSL